MSCRRQLGHTSARERFLLSSCVIALALAGALTLSQPAGAQNACEGYGPPRVIGSLGGPNAFSSSPAYSLEELQERFRRRRYMGRERTAGQLHPATRDRHTQHSATSDGCREFQPGF